MAALKPIGGTAIDDALAAAIQPAEGQAQSDRPYLVVFLTDGKPTIGATDEDEIVAKVAQAHGGADAAHLLLRDRHRREHPSPRRPRRGDARGQPVRAARGGHRGQGLELLLEDQPARPREPEAALRRRRGPAHEALSAAPPRPLPGRAARRLWPLQRRRRRRGHDQRHGERRAARTFSERTSFPAKATDHAFIPRLWATRRVGFLLDEIRLHGESTRSCATR